MHTIHRATNSLEHTDLTTQSRTRVPRTWRACTSSSCRQFLRCEKPYTSSCLGMPRWEFLDRQETCGWGLNPRELCQNISYSTKLIKLFNGTDAARAPSVSNTVKCASSSRESRFSPAHLCSYALSCLHTVR